MHSKRTQSITFLIVILLGLGIFVGLFENYQLTGPTLTLTGQYTRALYATLISLVLAIIVQLTKSRQRQRLLTVLLIGNAALWYASIMIIPHAYPYRQTIVLAVVTALLLRRRKHYTGRAIKLLTIILCLAHLLVLLPGYNKQVSLLGFWTQQPTTIQLILPSQVDTTTMSDDGFFLIITDPSTANIRKRSAVQLLQPQNITLTPSMRLSISASAAWMQQYTADAQHSHNLIRMTTMDGYQRHFLPQTTRELISHPIPNDPLTPRSRISLGSDNAQPVVNPPSITRKNSLDSFIHHHLTSPRYSSPLGSIITQLKLQLSTLLDPRYETQQQQRYRHNCLVLGQDCDYTEHQRQAIADQRGHTKTTDRERGLPQWHE